LLGQRRRQRGLKGEGRSLRAHVPGLLNQQFENAALAGAALAAVNSARVICVFAAAGETLADSLKPGSALRDLSATKQVILYCAYGERSAMALRAAHAAGLTSMRHLQGGFNAWESSGFGR
jgi:rhodanese-related sulfurtransferase